MVFLDHCSLGMLRIFRQAKPQTAEHFGPPQKILRRVAALQSGREELTATVGVSVSVPARLQQLAIYRLSQPRRVGSAVESGPPHPQRVSAPVVVPLPSIAAPHPGRSAIALLGLLPDTR